ncbi:MAG: single-stranded DNA-binding protein [Nitrospirae bacterium]|nr:single-stranded DNA-binding protein [Nitrospirota bacterium]
MSYFDIVVFGKQAEITSQYLSKGSSVLVDGRLNQRRWDDKDTGQKRSKVEIVAEVVRFMSKKGQTQGGSHGASEPEYSDSDFTPREVTDDEVPF